MEVSFLNAQKSQNAPKQLVKMEIILSEHSNTLVNIVKTIFKSCSGATVT